MTTSEPAIERGDYGHLIESLTVLSIRRLTDDDILRCLDLDPGYQTGWSWQLERRDHDEETTFSLRPVQLPRPRFVEGFPIDPPLDIRLQRAGLALLVEDSGFAGYVLVLRSAGEARLDMLVVAPDLRRQGIGTRLLSETRSWARRGGLRRICATVDIRNYPAIRFLRRNNFVLCGLEDLAGLNGEVVVHFSSAAS